MINLRYLQVSESDITQLVEMVVALIAYHKAIDQNYSSRLSIEAMAENLRLEIPNLKVFILLAKDGNKLVGFIRGAIQERKDRAKDFGLLQDIFVLPAYRKKGLAIKLLQDFESWVKQKGIKRIELQVDVRNRPAVDFWDKAGFVDYQVRKVKEI